MENARVAGAIVFSVINALYGARRMMRVADFGEVDCYADVMFVMYELVC